MMANNSFTLDLKQHHGQCEINYHLMLGLIPDCRGDNHQWHIDLDSRLEQGVVVKRLELCPYTTTLQITSATQASCSYWPSSFQVRLYHDVEMAEVVAWNNHRHWLPVYSYPNPRMYQRDEKLALNRFLGEWLVYCRKVGAFTLNYMRSFS